MWYEGGKGMCQTPNVHFFGIDMAGAARISGGMIDKKAELAAFEAKCFAARQPIYRVCERADVAQSTVSRWRKNPNAMSASTLRRLEDALQLIEAEKRP